MAKQRTTTIKEGALYYIDNTGYTRGGMRFEAYSQRHKIVIENISDETVTQLAVEIVTHLEKRHAAIAEMIKRIKK
jgi:hypothetical protein